MAVNESENE